jgi:indole-3-glycerol phosphate synthase
MSDFLNEMALLSTVRVAHIDDVAIAARAHHRPPPPAIDTRGFGLIAEIKFAAPSKGVPTGEAQPIAAAVERAKAYSLAGARAISVLTEPTRFGGALEHLAAVAASVDIPVMRKDFLVDPIQVLEARAYGAGGVLLIIRMLDEHRLDQMVQLAHELGMFVLLEAFDADDLARGAAFSNCLLGLNCRNLHTLEVDPSRFELLADAFPPAVVRVAESGLIDADAVRDIARAGYGMALVGSALMSNPTPGVLLSEMIQAGEAVR